MVAEAVRHLYVHVPFCRTRCAYCDFASEALRPAARNRVAVAYLVSLREELDTWRSLLNPRLDTVYVGGGTPTHLPAETLLDMVRMAAAGTPAAAGIDEGGRAGAGSVLSGEPWPREVTVEANPESLEEVTLRRLLAEGVTRLSVGIQSFDASLRRVLGRRVADEDIRRACALPRACGLQNWNIDLIFGVPGQSWVQAERDLARAVAEEPAHISLYDLTYTPRFAGGLARLLGPGAQARAQAFAERHYERAVTLLEREGYGRYEVSNFARPGFECRHNQAYWRGHDYLGVGAGAVSTVERWRWTNPAPSEVYCRTWAPGRREQSIRTLDGDRLASLGMAVEELTSRTKLFELAMLGLRTRHGVPRRLVEPVLDQARTAILLERGVLEERCGTLTVSAGGLNVVNAVLSAILLPPAAE